VRTFRLEGSVKMTVSMRLMTAGNGCKYLLTSVATGDGDRALSTSLTRYYTEAGCPQWSKSSCACSRLGSSLTGRLAEVG
jgi:hypothetical protein